MYKTYEVPSEIIGKICQRHLFDMGYEWVNTGREIFNAPRITINTDDNKLITNKRGREITTEELLSIGEYGKSEQDREYEKAIDKLEICDSSKNGIKNIFKLFETYFVSYHISDNQKGWGAYKDGILKFCNEYNISYMTVSTIFDNFERYLLSKYEVKP